MKSRLNSVTKEEKAENVLKILEDKENLIRSALKNRYIRFILISATVYGVLYVSRYFINTSAETVRAVKNLRNAVRE